MSRDEWIDDQPLCSRRTFVGRASALLAVMATACNGDATTAADAPPFEIDANEIRVRVAAVPSLERLGGAFIIYEANVIVVRAAERDYRVLSNVCTHAGCGVTQVVADRLRCPCHGSEFDLEGVNVVGPAPSPLARHDAVLDEAAGLLRISRRRV